MKSIEPISGWMLDRIVALDTAKPGFAGFVLRSSAERRQVIAAFLAVTELDDDAGEEAALFLAESDHRSILHLAYQNVPRALRGALRRSGPQAHDADYYRRLFDLLRTGPHHVVTAIQHSAKLDPDRLAIISSLPRDLCDIRIFAKIKDKAQASDLILAVDLLERRGIDRGAVIEALRRSDKLADTIKRWSYRMDFPRGPISAGESYRPITNGLELVATAKRYRNCSRRYFTSLLAGEHAFGEFQHDGHHCLISFDRSQGFWRVEGVYTYRNGDVLAGVSQAAYAFAAHHGVLTRRATERGDKAMEALRRLSRYYMDWDV